MHKLTPEEAVTMMHPECVGKTQKEYDRLINDPIFQAMLGGVRVCAKLGLPNLCFEFLAPDDMEKRFGDKFDADDRLKFQMASNAYVQRKRAAELYLMSPKPTQVIQRVNVNQ